MQLHRMAAVLGVCAVLPFASLAAEAQSTQASIEAHLFKQELYLRDSRQGNNLKFDAAGNTLNACPKHAAECSEPFTLNGVDVTNVDLEAGKLVLTGTRAWLEFQPKPLRIPRKGKITLEIAAPPDGDYVPALDKIFAYGLADLTRSLPEVWQPYATRMFLGEIPALVPRHPAPGPAPVVQLMRPPKLTNQVEPEITDAAREMSCKAIVVLDYLVGIDGKTHSIHIVQPAGLGLDESAIAAVSRYVFKPATKSGQPVAVEIHSEVGFGVF